MLFGGDPTSFTVDNIAALSGLSVFAALPAIPEVSPPALEPMMRWRAASSTSPGWQGDEASKDDRIIPISVKSLVLRNKFFYPLIRYSAFVEPDNRKSKILFSTPVNLLELTPTSIRSDAVAWSGAEQSLFNRQEDQVRLVWSLLDKSVLDELWTFWTTHAQKGLPAELVLDRLGTCAGQWEFDEYNQFFTRAKLVQMQFAPRRGASLALTKYVVELIFRQDAA